MHLKTLRQNSGLKISFIATKINKSRQTYHNYEVKKSRPDLYTIIKLAELFDVDFTIIEQNIKKR